MENYNDYKYLELKISIDNISSYIVNIICTIRFRDVNVYEYQIKLLNDFLFTNTKLTKSDYNKIYSVFDWAFDKFYTKLYYEPGSYYSFGSSGNSEQDKAYFEIRNKLYKMYKLL